MLLGFVVVAFLAAPAGYSALRDAQRGRDLILASEQSLRDQDPASARRLLAEARTAFRSADDRVSGGLAVPANHTPVLGRHLEVASGLARAGELIAEAGIEATHALDERPAQGWRGSDGRIAVEALARASDHVDRAVISLDRAREVLEATPERFLVPQVGGQRTETLARLDEAAAGIEGAAAGLGAAPELLGADRSKRYYLTFSNLAELRGTGGLLGFYVVLEIDDGHLRLTELDGRAQDDFPEPATRDPQAPDWYLDAYGRYQPFEIWQNLNVTTDFPTVGDLLLQSVPQSLHPLDGVIQLDPIVLAELLSVAGPVSVEGWPEPLTSENLSAVTQHEAYVRYEGDREARVAFLDDVVGVVFDHILSSIELSDDLVTTLGGAVAGGHIQMYAADAGLQEALREAGLARGVDRASEASDVLGFVTQNGSGNKVDWFLRREVAYEVALDPTRREARGRLSATLSATHPASGLPDYVIAPGTPGVPEAVNRVLLMLLRAPEDVQEELLVSGEHLQTSRDHEEDLVAYQTAVDLGPGESKEVTGRFTTELSCERRRCAYRLHVLRQPVAHTDRYRIDITVPAGWEVEGDRRFEGPLTEDLVFEVELRQTFRAWAVERLIAGPGRVARNLLDTILSR